MSFTRSFLKSIGLTEEQISAALEEHTSVTKYLQGQIDQYKADAEKHKADAERLPAVQKELDELKARKDYKADYDKAVQDLNDYKAKVAKDELDAKIRAAYRAVAKDAGIGEKYLDVVLKAADLSAVKLDADGKPENADDLKASILKEWPEFKVSTRQRGENVDHPPKGDDGGQPLGEIREIGAKRRAERYGALPTNQ